MTEIIGDFTLYLIHTTLTIRWSLQISGPTVKSTHFKPRPHHQTALHLLEGVCGLWINSQELVLSAELGHTGLMASEYQHPFDLLKIQQFFFSTQDSLGKIYKKLRKMRAKSEAKYTECCNKLIAVVEEAQRYFDEVRVSLAFSRSKLGLINEVQQTESDPLNYSAMKDLVTQLNKCISQVQKFQSGFSKQCDDAIEGVNEMALKCDASEATAQSAKTKARAVGFLTSMASGVVIGSAVALSFGTAVGLSACAATTVGLSAGAATTVGLGRITHTWANDYEEVKKKLIEIKEKLKELLQTSTELQKIIDSHDPRPINSVERLIIIKPLADTIDRLSTVDGEIHNREGLQTAFKSLAEELKRIHQEHTSSPSPQENLEAIRKKLKRNVANEPEDCTAEKKKKQS